MKEKMKDPSCIAVPVAVASTEDKALDMCDILEKRNPDYNFWCLIFEEDKV